MLDSTPASFRPAPPRAGATPAGQVTGRALIALLFIVSGLQKATDFAAVAEWMASEGLPFASLALAATIVLEIVGGLALAVGVAVRPAAWTLGVFVVAASVVFHAFWSVPAEQLADQLSHFLKNAAILGGLLLVAGQAGRAA